MQAPDHWPQEQIFNETAKLHRNTVNGGLPGGNRESCVSSNGNSTNGESAPPPAQLSTLRKPGR
jgi:hypothetical protein